MNHLRTQFGQARFYRRFVAVQQGANQWQLIDVQVIQIRPDSFRVADIPEQIAMSGRVLEVIEGQVDFGQEVPSSRISATLGLPRFCEIPSR
jgi:hypothetical protein